jgi:hypothetical protein
VPFTCAESIRVMHPLFQGEQGGSIPTSALQLHFCDIDLRLELRRFAIAPDAPRNTGSRMLSWMTREIKKRRPEIGGVLSYQDCDVHQGTIYKAAGWIMTAKSFDHRDRGLRSGRKRNRSQTTATKQRWEKNL